MISFDFKQHKGVNQTRKTRFFRELYGYTQQIKQQLKDGEIVVRTYHYPGVLEQLPYTKLGKSVLAVPPGNEGTIIKLLRAYDEVEFYYFIGWLPTSLWPRKDDVEAITVNNLIVTHGYLSIVKYIQNSGMEIIQHSDLLDAGFDMNYLSQAVQYLTNKKLLTETQNELKLTSKGKQIISQVE